MEVAVLLFQDFETLDVFGPVEIFGRLKDFYSVKFYSLNGGLVQNEHGISILTERGESMKEKIEIFLIPGGHGTRSAVNDQSLVELTETIATKSRFVLTVCTGTALLAKTGLLDAKQATTNKRAFSWVMTQGPSVHWNKKARWVIDGKYYTSSGVSAGIDMSLGFLADQHGIEFAETVAKHIEYNWIRDKDNDSFVAE